MQPVKNNMTSGFLARVTFFPEAAEAYSFCGSQIVEMLYTEDEDVYELIDFIEQHKDAIKDVMVLMPGGQVIDARQMSTQAE
jgi:hypothetical protein